MLSMDVSKQDLLAASIGNGKLCVWDMKTKELKKTFEGLAKVKSFEAVLNFGTTAGGLLLLDRKGLQLTVRFPYLQLRQALNRKQDPCSLTRTERM